MHYTYVLVCNHTHGFVKGITAPVLQAAEESILYFPGSITGVHQDLLDFTSLQGTNESW